MKKIGCKGFREHSWVDDPDDKPDPRVDWMTAFYLGWYWRPEQICRYCELKEASQKQ